MPEVCTTDKETNPTKGKNLGSSEMIHGILGEFTTVKVSTCVLLKNPPVLKNEIFTVFIKLDLGKTLVAN